MRIALLISGGGTTMAAIIKVCQSGELAGIEPVLVIASKPDAGGISKARALGIPEADIVVISPKEFETPEAFGEALITACHAKNVDFIGQYGWLAKTPANVCEAFKGMIINQHPGPLDAGHLDFGGVGMYGMRVHAARLEFVQKTNRDFWTEATAHRVTENFDEGVVVHKIQVPILENDTPETLQARVLLVEHQVQIETLQQFASGTVQTITRTTPLVLPGEEGILSACKENAIKAYPHG
jgi:phosphoribosylglycinamide formyltransferase-1